MLIVPAQVEDIDEATATLVSAFATDPLIDFFFLTIPERREEAARKFFSLLLRARIAIGMPVLLGKENGQVIGTVMGNSTSRPDWPAPVNDRWEALEAGIPGMADRTAVYKTISDGGLPSSPHYYLGVLGVSPTFQGKGAGRALLEAFCAVSQADSRSAGVYLETASPENLPLYRRAGFCEKNAGSLGKATLWCLFRPHDARDALSSST